MDNVLHLHSLTIYDHESDLHSSEKITIVSLFDIPMMKKNFFMNFTEQHGVESSIFYQIIISIYETQFGYNFLTYAFTNEQYRNAYAIFWKYLTCRDVSETSSTTHTSKTFIVSIIDDRNRMVKSDVIKI